MKPAGALVVLGMVSCVAAARLPAQSLASARVGLAQRLAVSVAPRAAPVFVIPAAGTGPRRWPYVVVGALVGGAAGGVWVARRAARTDDAMVFPSYVAVAVAGGAAVGALGGLIVSVAIHPGAR